MVFLLAFVTLKTAAGALLKMLALLSDPGYEYCLSEEHTLLQAASLLSQGVTLVRRIPAAGNESYSLLRLSLASVKWYNGRMRLFLFFPRLHRAS